MVPPPRNYAADAHECIMGSGRKARRIQGCGAMIGRPRYGSPRDSRLAEPMAAPRSPDIIVRRQPTRETSLVVSRKSPEREARTPMCASTKALGSSTSGGLCPPARASGERSSARDGRNLGPPTSAADRRRWPDACKGWPSATASGGFGLDKRLASDIRRQVSTGKSGPRADPRRASRGQTERIFPLDKERPHTRQGEGPGDWPDRRRSLAPPRTRPLPVRTKKPHTTPLPASSRGEMLWGGRRK